MLSYLTTAFFENLSETFGFVLFIVWVVEGSWRNSWKYRSVNFREYGDNGITNPMRLIG